MGDGLAVQLSCPARLGNSVEVRKQCGNGGRSDRGAAGARSGFLPRDLSPLFIHRVLEHGTRRCPMADARIGMYGTGQFRGRPIQPILRK